MSPSPLERPLATTVPSLEHLQRRAAALRATRRWFEQRGYLEVETPIARRHASMEPFLTSFETTLLGPDGTQETRFLHTSPEYAMKEVLGQLGVSIFQLATVFRNEEESATHLPEFTLLEWYRVGADYRVAMRETEALVRTIAREAADAWPTVRHSDVLASFATPFERITVREAFMTRAEIDPWAVADGAEFARRARAIGIDVPDDWSWEDVFHLVLLERIEPHLGRERPTFLFDYPPRLAALARIRHGTERKVAERFELYVCGMEMCNGFTELTDADEQRRRFEAERALRRRLGRPVHAIDEGLLAALARCPPCTGNALGFDRLMMCLLEADSLRAVRVAEAPVGA